LRNDAQHKAKYPNETDVSDCRTYTRDFLAQTFFDVWGESFESISLVDVIQNVDIKNLLLEAEQDFAKNDYTQTVIKSMASFQIMIGGLANSITGHIDYYIDGIVVTETFREPATNRNLFTAFMRMRDITAFQVIGINLQEYLKYKRFTRFVGVSIMADDSYHANLSSDDEPSKDEAEYVFNFVTNAIILIENLDEDITKAYDRFR
jgi:hypothetical protein